MISRYFPHSTNHSNSRLTGLIISPYSAVLFLRYKPSSQNSRTAEHTDCKMKVRPKEVRFRNKAMPSRTVGKTELTDAYASQVGIWQSWCRIEFSTEEQDRIGRQMMVQKIQQTRPQYASFPLILAIYFKSGYILRCASRKPAFLL